MSKEDELQALVTELKRLLDIEQQRTQLLREIIHDLITNIHAPKSSWPCGPK